MERVIAEEDELAVEVKPKSAVDKAVDFLREILVEGPVEMGISESALSRAKKKTQVVYLKNGDGSAFWKIDYAV